jgi:hypothetical protein
MSYRHFTAGIFLVLLAFGCTKKLSKDELANVLVDMYVYDQLYIRANLYKQDSISVYRSVFQKHNCAEKQFGTSIRYYGFDPKHLKEVFAKADEKIKLLKKNYEDVVSLQHKERALQMKMDSLYRYPADTFYRRIFNRCLLLDAEFAMDVFQSVAVADTVTSITSDIETVKGLQSGAAINALTTEATLDRGAIVKPAFERDTAAKRMIRREAVMERVSDKETR